MSRPRMDRYVPLIREFAAREGLLHDAVARKLGLHATDEKVLRLLGDGAMTAGGLAGQTGLTGAAVTALVDRLEAYGFVTRERDAEDRRRVTIRVVPAKVREINQLYAPVSAEIAKMLAKYSAAEYAVIVDYLTNATRVLAEQTEKLSADEADNDRRRAAP
jgi:MarR family transcriptional regulator, organic hydroperoxide resistance regulator